MSRIITIAHQKGGVGKSTIAANLGVELSKKHKVKIVDLDMQMSLSFFSHKRSSHNLSNLDVSRIASPTELKNIIDKNHDIVIIDVGGYDSDMSRRAIIQSDIIITPVSNSGIELNGLLSFRKVLRDLRRHRSDLTSLLLLNRIHPRANCTVSEIDDFVKDNDEFSMLNSILRYRAEYRNAYDRGISVVEHGGKASEEINNLLKEIVL